MQRRVLVQRVARLASEKETAAACILLAAMLLNPLLAVVNGHVMGLRQVHVALVEVCVTGCACLLIAMYARRPMAPWMLLGLLLLTLQVFLALFNQSFNPKFARDVLIIPIFVMLGMVYARGNVVRLFSIIQVIVVVFMLLEAFALEAFSNLFQIVRYYINTRDFSATSFWNQDLSLFVSATRPNERFLFASLGIHRLSSIFLEPVSLGNYCIVATLFILSFWDRMPSRTRAFFVSTTVLLLIGSDGRLATATCAILAAGSYVFPRLPPLSNVLYLPAVLVLAFACVHVFGWTSYSDDFAGRTAGSVELLSSLSLDSVFGLNPLSAGGAMDTGMAYFLLTQSIFGVVAIWLSVCLVPAYSTRTTTILVHGLCVYMSLNLLVSYSLFSIKTAAPLWFLYGYVIHESLLRSRSPSGFVPANSPYRLRAARHVSGLSTAVRRDMR